MMKPPASKRILREDVKEAGSWITPMLDVLNSFMENVYQGLNRNITFSENISCQIKELTYKTPSTYPTGVEETQFLSSLRVRASGLVVWQAYERTTYVAAPGPVYAPWVEDAGTIRIGTITGLEPDKTYTIRLLLS